jgi:hypothetical protein
MGLQLKQAMVGMGDVAHVGGAMSGSPLLSDRWQNPTGLSHGGLSNP